MSRESIQIIKETEAQADRILEDAKRRSREMIERATREGDELCERVERESRASLEATMAQLRERTAAMSGRMETEAREEAEKLRSDAALRRRSAEKIVIGRLMSKCR